MCIVVTVDFTAERKTPLKGDISQFSGYLLCLATAKKKIENSRILDFAKSPKIRNLLKFKQTKVTRSTVYKVKIVKIIFHFCRDMISNDYNYVL